MTDYDVTCGTTACQIQVEARPTIRSHPLYVATPYLIEGRTIVPIAKPIDPGAVVLPSSTEAYAVQQAVEFLERRFGPKTAAARLTPSSAATLEIKPPRKVPELSKVKKIVQGANTR